MWQHFPFSGAPRLYRGVLLDVLREPELALADYRQALMERHAANDWNPDQAALAIWTIRSLQGERAEADEELRRHFAGRKPDFKENWYVWLADFLLDRHADEAALIGRCAIRGAALRAALVRGGRLLLYQRSPPTGRRQVRRQEDAGKGRGHQSRRRAPMVRE